MRFHPIYLAILLAAFTSDASAGSLTIPKTFVSGETARASEVNDNFSAVKTEVDDNNARINQNESTMSFKQERVSGSCPAGQSIRVINPDGTVTCEQDDNTNTTYTAGSGINLNGTEFSADSATLQGRVNGSCAAGESIRVINPDGTVVCEVDSDTDTNTTYSAGSGMKLNGTVFSTDSTVSQHRVNGSCAAGESINAINEDGSVTCQPDANTTYSAGTGLKLNAGVFTSDPAQTQKRLGQSCAAGSSIRAINEDGTVDCQLDTNSTYSAGSGMQMVGTELRPADGWVSVPPSAFVAAGIPSTACKLSVQSSAVNFVNNNMIGVFTECDVYAPLNLPHGATLTELQCKVDDSSGRAIDNVFTAALHRVPITGNSTVAQSVFSTGGSTDINTGAQIISGSTAASGTDVVDNELYAYQLFVDWSTYLFFYDDIQFFKIYGCRVGYVYP